MRPENLRTKIFLDSGDPDDTKKVIEKLGFLDGQTTNPSLVAKNPDVLKRQSEGQKYSSEELNDFYKSVVRQISDLIPDGSVSIEVYADSDSTSKSLFTQGREFATWIPNAHVKYPIIGAGLDAALQSIAAGMRVNMTLCFDQQQAAAVYAATSGAQRGDVFVSPFIGRLDDKGLNGVDLIGNILKMYNDGDRHVEVLAASVRSLAHFQNCLAIGADIITAPYSVIAEWAEAGMPIPEKNSSPLGNSELHSIEYEQVALNESWDAYNVQHELTDAGLDRFASDWNGLLS
jgi:transaldolase